MPYGVLRCGYITVNRGSQVLQLITVTVDTARRREDGSKCRFERLMCLVLGIPMMISMHPCGGWVGTNVSENQNANQYHG